MNLFEKLPKDGAAYPCTTFRTGENPCLNKGTVGLTVETYTRIQSLTYTGRSNIHTMRAVCQTHADLIETELIGE